MWTKSAFEALDTVFGTIETESGAKRGYRLPRTPMTNSDLTRLINSDEIQSIVNAPKVRANPGADPDRASSDGVITVHAQTRMCTHHAQWHRR